MARLVVARTFGPQAPDADHDPESGWARFIAAGWAEPRFHWLRSFGRAGSRGGFAFCVYDGPDRRELGIQQRLCGLEFDEIREVQEVVGAASEFGPDLVREGWCLVLAERDFGAGLDPRTLLDVNAPFVDGTACLLWLRSYWDAERGSSQCLFAASSKDVARDAVTIPGVRMDRFAKVAANHPSHYGHIYDRLGLPRHWETPNG